MLDPRQSSQCVLRRPNLDMILEADLDLAGSRTAVLAAVDRNTSSRKGFEAADGPLRLHFDRRAARRSVFGAVNALVAADIRLGAAAVPGLRLKSHRQLLQIIEQVQDQSGIIACIVLTMYDVRNSLTFSVEDIARKRFQALVPKTVIPINVRIAEAPLDGVDVGEYEPDNAGSGGFSRSRPGGAAPWLGTRKTNWQTN